MATKMKKKQGAIELGEDIMSKDTKHGEQDVVEPLPFEVKELHQKALKVLFRCHHNSNGDKTVTYDELSLMVGSGKKTKNWQCGAYRDLKQNGFILSDNGRIELSVKGVQLAQTFCSEEELAEFKEPASQI